MLNNNEMRNKFMSQDLINDIKKAIEISNSWAENGWAMTFGPRKYSVNSLKEAEALSHENVFKIEAVAYWIRVKQAGEEASSYGQKAIEALESNNMKAADDAIYYACFLEKFYDKHTQTWKPVYNKIKVAA